MANFHISRQLLIFLFYAMLTSLLLMNIHAQLNVDNTAYTELYKMSNADFTEKKNSILKYIRHGVRSNDIREEGLQKALLADSIATRTINTIETLKQNLLNEYGDDPALFQGGTAERKSKKSVYNFFVQKQYADSIGKMIVNKRRATDRCFSG